MREKKTKPKCRIPKIFKLVTTMIIFVLIFQPDGVSATVSDASSSGTLCSIKYSRQGPECFSRSSLYLLASSCSSCKNWKIDFGLQKMTTWIAISVYGQHLFHVDGQVGWFDGLVEVFVRAVIKFRHLLPVVNKVLQQRDGRCNLIKQWFFLVFRL